VRCHANSMTDGTGPVTSCGARTFRPLTGSTCANCGSGLLQLEAWKERGDGAMTLRLRCPECFVRIVGDFTADQVARLDRAVSEARLEMVALYQATVCENLWHEAALMSRALALDLIGADDFSGRRSLRSTGVRAATEQGYNRFAP
jgi:hypothetical protein